MPGRWTTNNQPFYHNNAPSLRQHVRRYHPVPLPPLPPVRSRQTAKLTVTGRKLVRATKSFGNELYLKPNLFSFFQDQ